MADTTVSPPPPSPSPFLKVAEIQGRGRSLVASQTIKAGQILLRDSPLLLYPSSSSPSSPYCSHCFRSLDRSHLLSCPTCPGRTFFCSPTCQSSALVSSHSPWVCRSLALLPSLLPNDLHPQGLFLVSAYNLASLSPPPFSLLLSLQGDPSSSSSSPEEPKEALALHSFISSLSPPPLASIGGEGFSSALIAALLAKDKHNAFALMEPSCSAGTTQRSVRAYGIYPNASFFNHDCLPNACWFDYVDSPPSSSSSNNSNTDIIVRAIHDIEQGREICLSYFPVNWSYADRQRRLLEDYGFVCDCDRCQVERNWKVDDVDDGDADALMDDDDNDDGERMRMESGAAEEEEEEENDDFPHAYFFVRYQCQKENCGGTLAPLPPADDGTAVAVSSSNILECNVCGQLREEEDHYGDDLQDDDMMDT